MQEDYDFNSLYAAGSFTDLRTKNIQRLEVAPNPRKLNLKKRKTDQRNSPTLIGIYFTPYILPKHGTLHDFGRARERDEQTARAALQALEEMGFSDEHYYTPDLVAILFNPNLGDLTSSHDRFNWDCLERRARHPFLPERILFRNTWSYLGSSGHWRERSMHLKHVMDERTEMPPSKRMELLREFGRDEGLTREEFAILKQFETTGRLSYCSTSEENLVEIAWLTPFKVSYVAPD